MKLLLPIIIVLVLISGYFVLSKNNASNIAIAPKSSQVQSPSPTPQLKTFKSSSVMKFTIDVPSDSSVEEKFGSVKISSDKGEILIGQNGTNMNNLNDYILNSKNNINFKITERKDLIINGLNGVSGILDGVKNYFIFSPSNYTVYILSTKNKDLFPSLDQIARSFRYTP